MSGLGATLVTFKYIVKTVPQFQVDDALVAPISMARPQLLDHEIFMDERAFLSAALDALGRIIQWELSQRILHDFAYILIPLRKRP